MNNCLKDVLAEKAALVEGELRRLLGKNPEMYSVIYRAMEYSVNAGGKRLRPAIMLMTADMLGGREEAVLPFACALEMIHTYSLIHDDLPAMDNDDLRRGKPTNHRVFGEATAILAGDALLTKAFEAAAAAHGTDSGTVLKAIAVLAEAAGGDGMIAGQIIDIGSQGKSIDEETLKRLHELKTGALLRAAGVIGAVLSGADSDTVKAVEEYCAGLGMAFQIRDDILDVSGTVEELGKPIGSDLENNKVTYVTLYGIDGAEKLVGEYTRKAKNAISGLKNSELLTELADYLAERRK